MAFRAGRLAGTSSPSPSREPSGRPKNRKIEPSEILRKKRYVVEQFNGHVKGNVLDECWIRPRGLAKKAAMVTAGLISYNAEAIRSLIVGEKSLKTVSKYWA